MPASTVTSKGQVTIPAEVRRDLGVGSGSRVNFVRVRPGVYELVPETRSIAAIKGIVPAPTEPVTLDEMDEAIAAGAAEGTRR